MPERQRVVIDTNVFISALLTPAGMSRRAIDLALGKFVVVMSANTMRREAAPLELEEKLSAAKFRSILSSADVEDFLDSLVQRVEFFVPTTLRARSRDVKDDIFLNLAETVGATYLITGDKDLLSLRRSHGIADLDVLQPAQFVDRCG